MNLVVHRIRPGAAPCPSVLLARADPEARPYALVSGPGDPRLSSWSYGALEACGAVESLEAAERAIAGWEVGAEGPPFCGGAVGYVGYDAGWPLQLRPRPPRPDPLGMAAESFGLYDAIYARERTTGEGYVLAQPTARAEARARRILHALDAGESGARSFQGALTGDLLPAVPRALHLRRIEETLGLIAAGEIYQANITYPLIGTYRGDPEAAFLRLLHRPPPFAAFLRTSAEACVVSASPECFFDLGAHGEIAVYPIKGTRPRSADPARDRALAEELAGDKKERAEHMMIVDLLRNDLGRIARIGSVAPDGLAYVESFPQIHHLTSRIVGRMEGAPRASAVMRALFPGGSITGVPKLRAMEIIDRLEDRARGVYTGAILYASPSGEARGSIAIRTAQIARGALVFGVGGGIVADSIPDREWEETIVKARALKEAL